MIDLISICRLPRSKCRIANLIKWFILMSVGLTTDSFGELQYVSPTSSFTVRLVGGESGYTTLVGDASKEGTVWNGGELFITEETPDRAVAEFDLRGLSQNPSVTLNVYMFNFDTPSFTNIELYTFKGNGLANAADFYRTDKLVTTFTDSGLATDEKKYSLNVTAAFNDAVANGDDYLGLLFKNVVVPQSFARYGLGGGDLATAPTLVIGVPEPASVVLLLLATIAVAVWKGVKP